LIKKEQKIFVAGHRGMVGSSILRALKSEGYKNVIIKNKNELDLTIQSEVEAFFNLEKPELVFLAAAKVGGIYANNTYPADFIYQNLMIESNVIHQSWRSGVKRLLFLGSSCAYPKFTEQPIPEHALLSGSLEPTNEPYAIAKIAGIKLCESYNRQYGVDFRSLMPCNLYGSGDNYHSENSHVIPGLIWRFHEAKFANLDSVIIWGSGLPQREFLYVDDLANASLFIMNLDKELYYSKIFTMQSHINVGFGSDISIYDLTMLIKDIVGFEGKIIFDKTKPDGTQNKLMDSSLIKSFGWAPKIYLKAGLKLAYSNFLEQNKK